VIVGAGASGLAVGAALKRRGIEPVLLDRDTEVGGTWARRYERLHLHTIKSLSALPFRPIPKSEPRYVPSSRYARYLADYAQAQRLDIRLDHEVQRVAREGAEWIVATPRETWRAPVVVIATGRHNVPRLPSWPGAREYRGPLVHSHEYRTGRAYAGQRALVIGIGNSGAEIAADLVECGASSVSIAVRTTPPITSREIAGIPVQILGIFFKPFPARFVDWLGRGLRRIGTGDLRGYGLGSERWGPFTARRPPVIDVGFLGLLKQGRIAVRPDVARFTPGGVVFVDGSTLDVDVVVAATGYATGLESLLDASVLDARGFPAADVRTPGLYFAGYNETPRGQLFESARAAPVLARRIESSLGVRRSSVASAARGAPGAKGTRSS
jgi:cation diffusion facilitator CzcD-associated flavoprotein CzcO